MLILRREMALVARHRRFLEPQSQCGSQLKFQRGFKNFGHKPVRPHWSYHVWCGFLMLGCCSILLPTKWIEEKWFADPDIDAKTKKIKELEAPRQPTPVDSRYLREKMEKDRLKLERQTEERLKQQQEKKSGEVEKVVVAS